MLRKPLLPPFDRFAVHLIVMNARRGAASSFPAHMSRNIKNTSATTPRTSLVQNPLLSSALRGRPCRYFGAKSGSFFAPVFYAFHEINSTYDRSQTLLTPLLHHDSMLEVDCALYLGGRDTKRSGWAACSDRSHFSCQKI